MILPIDHVNDWVLKNSKPVGRYMHRYMGICRHIEYFKLLEAVNDPWVQLSSTTADLRTDVTYLNGLWRRSIPVSFIQSANQYEVIIRRYTTFGIYNVCYMQSIGLYVAAEDKETGIQTTLHDRLFIEVSHQGTIKKIS